MPKELAEYQKIERSIITTYRRELWSPPQGGLSCPFRAIHLQVPEGRRGQAGPASSSGLEVHL